MSDPQSTSVPAPPEWAGGRGPVRVDLHRHSRASTEASEALLLAIGCPESFSEPREVYDQAKLRGMDFVTLTDHDTLDGVLPLSTRRRDVLLGEELTCWFPEDRCKIHLLLWGLTGADHSAVQGLAHDIYAVACYVEQRQIAHAVAHPVYRQNDRLERWHLERLMLLFKGFECLNGAHSALHREAFEPLLDGLTPERVRELSEQHVVPPHWPRPWEKARTGGSDDHLLFNIGRTWTEFPPDAKTTADVLRCLRQGRCRPGGEAGSSLKLAHNFYSVGVRYLDRRARREGATPGKATHLLRALVGEGRSPRKRDLLRAGLRDGMARLGRIATAPLRWARPRPASATHLLTDCLPPRL